MHPAAMIRASHPEPAAAVTAVAALLSISAGRAASGVVLAALAVLGSQLAIGWVNDAVDAPRDTLVGRRDKPVAAGEVSRRLVAGLGAGAAALTVPLAFLSGPRAGLALTLALVSALLYDWPLKSTVFSVVPYAVSFACLPAFTTFGAGKVPPVWLVLAGGLLGAGAHFVNVLPDLADDARTGVRGLPHLLGFYGSLAAAGVLLVGATVALAFGPPGPVRWPGWTALGIALAVLLFGVYVATRDRASKTPFRTVMVVALVDVVLLLIS
jgi:protoheme IX farnesyltransferase